MNKKLLCTVVGGALAVSAGTAQARLDNTYYNALVPYVVKDANRTTVVTTIMDNNSVSPGTPNLLHLQYHTKSTTDANTAACLPSSVQVPVTPSDIITFDTAGILGYPLFGDSTNPAANGMAISYAAPRHGYLVVQSPYAYNNFSGLYLLNTYWLELDLANGGAHGDQAILNDYGVASPDFTNTSDWMSLLGSSTTPPSGLHGTQVAFFPSSVASTVFTVTPLGSDMVLKENNQVTLQVFNDNSTRVQGAYDRNENGVDGTVPITVRCVGRVTPAQLMPGVVANASWAAQGGWGNLVNLGANNTSGPDLRAAIYQVDTGSAGGKFVDNAVRITTSQN